MAGKKWGLFLEGGHRRASPEPQDTRATFTLEVTSAGTLFSRLKEAGAPLLHEAPQDMGNGTFWFQFRDPAGNILEAIGSR